MPGEKKTLKDPSSRASLPRNGRSDPQYLKTLGERVRQARARRGMTRKILARDSDVSERYLAQLEAGQGNISIVLLRQLTRALDMPLDALLVEGAEPSVDLVHTVELLRRLPAEHMAQVRQLIEHKFGGMDDEARRGRIALIGLRGAGKSTLGAQLAEKLAVPFIELDRMIEETSSMSMGEILDLYGQRGFRRLERRCLNQVIEQYQRFVMATGGSLVSEPATFERLLAMCFTVWVRTSPAEHISRVVAQGDMRPMANSRESLDDLRRILAAREPLYNKADFCLDTGRHTVEESLAALSNGIHK